MAVAVSNTPLPVIIAGAAWEPADFRFCGKDKNDPRPFADGSTFKVVLTRLGRATPPVIIFTEGVSFIDNVVSVLLDGEQTTAISPADYKFELVDITDEDNPRVLVVAPVEVVRSGELAAEMGGATAIPAGTSSPGFVVLNTGVVILDGTVSGAAAAVAYAQDKGDYAQEKGDYAKEMGDDASTALGLANQIVGNQETLIANAAGVLVEAEATRTETGLIRDETGALKDASFTASQQAAEALATVIAVLANGSIAYETYALMTGAFAGLPNGALIQVMTGTGAGTYLKKAGVGTPVQVSTDTLTLLGQKLSASTLISNDDDGVTVIFGQRSAEAPTERVVHRMWYDHATGVFWIDKLGVHVLEGVDISADGHFTSKVSLAALEAVKGDFDEGALGQVEEGPDSGFYRLEAGDWEQWTSMSLAGMADALSGRVKIVNEDDKEVIYAQTSAENPNHGVNRIWIEPPSVDPEQAVNVDLLRVGRVEKADGTPFAPEVLETVYEGSVYSGVDLRGRAFYNPFTIPRAIYVWGGGGQSLKVGQGSVSDLPLDAPNYDAIVERTYTPLTPAEDNPYPDNLLMPNCGSNVIGVESGDLTFTHFEPLGEYTHIPVGVQTKVGESSLTRSWITFMDEFVAAFPDAELPTIVAINYAIGSHSLAALGPGRRSWDALAATMRKIVEIADNDPDGPRPVIFIGEHYTGFEADTDLARHADPAQDANNSDPEKISGMEKETLIRMLMKRRVLLEESVTSITRGNCGWKVRLFLDQVNVGAGLYTLALARTNTISAQLEVHDRDPLCVAMGSKAGSPANPYDAIHQSGYGYAWVGDWSGHIYFREFCTVIGHQPLKAVKFYRTGATTFEVRWNRHWGIIGDSDMVETAALGVGKGVGITDGGLNLLPISAIEKSTTDPAVLKITLASPPAGYGQLMLHVSLNGGTLPDGTALGRFNRTGPRTAIHAIDHPLWYAHHHQPNFPGEVNTNGHGWPTYPDPMPVYELASQQQLPLTGRS